MNKTRQVVLTFKYRGEDSLTNEYGTMRADTSLAGIGRWYSPDAVELIKETTRRAARDEEANYYCKVIANKESEIKALESEVKSLNEQLALSKPMRAFEVSHNKGIDEIDCHYWESDGTTFAFKLNDGHIMAVIYDVHKVKEVK